MTFLEFSKILEKIENTSSRNEMTSILVELYSSLDIGEVDITSYLIQGRVAPYFVNSEFQVSEKTMLEVGSGLFKGDINNLRGKLGDIGSVYFQVLEKNVGKKLSVTQVYEYLWKIVNTKGSGSSGMKKKQISELMGMVTGLEGKFLSRIICGNLRLGSSEKTLLDTFSIILKGDKGVRDELDYAYGVCSDIGYISHVVMKSKNIDDVKNVQPVCGVPILSRLVERAKSFEELQERMGDEYIVQPKFDGLRLQIHMCKDGFEKAYSSRKWFNYIPKSEQGSMFESRVDRVKLYTRNLEDVTEMFPEIVEEAQKLKCNSIVIDSEVIGWDEKKNTFLSYQDTMTRKRKYGVDELSNSIPVRSFAFDIMYLDAESLVSKDTQERVEILRKMLVNGEKITLAQSLVIKSVEELKSFFNKCVEENLEGLIAKKLTGGYTPGGRNFEWIKLKKSFMNELSDSVDVVILGYYLGSGKRTKFGIGALLCGVYNESLDRFESVTKLGTGITDEMFLRIKERLDPLITSNQPKNVAVDKLLLPDVWVFPEVVCTVEADDITKAINKGEEVLSGGLSLRFPRLIEFDRDKLPQQATTVSELISLAS